MPMGKHERLFLRDPSTISLGNISIVSKHDHLLRDPTTLSARELTFLNLREPITLRAAEDGRKRSTLPPLEREPTFQRKPKYFNPYEGNSEEAGESHWKKKYEKVSIEVDSRVKSHLKKQLLSRFEKRLKKMEDAMSDDSSGRHGKDYNPWEGKEKRNGAENKELFNKYTDTGLRTSMAKSKTNQDESLPKLGAVKPDFYHGPQTIPANATKVQFPDIKQNGEIETNGHAPETETNTTHSDVTDGNISNGINGEVVNGESAETVENEDQRVFALTRLQTKFQQSFDMTNFRNLDVSPVQTPQVRRPLTREQTRLSLGDTMGKILRGQVHRTCPLRNKTIRVYLSSGFADSEAERTVIMEKVYPELRTLCALHGRELQMVDPHWGLKDDVVDDHSIMDVCLSNLQKCTRDHLQAVNMVVLLTDRYGDPVLPTKIIAEEFETILDAVKRYSNREMDKIQQQLAEIEGPLTDKDQMVGNHDNANSEQVNGIGSDATTISSLSRTDDGKENTQASDNTAPQTSTKVNYRKEHETKRDQQLIKTLREKQSLLPDPDMLETCYRLDENTSPHVYRLQNISAIVQDFGKGDASRKEVAKQAWLDIKSKLLKTFQEFGRKNSYGLFGNSGYFKSVLEHELDTGLLETDSNLEQCVVINRTIDDITSNLDDQSGDEYADVTDGKPHTIDTYLNGHLQNLKTNLIPSKVHDQYILPFDTSWAPGGIRIGGDRMHQTYLDRLSKHVYDVMRRRFLDSFKEDDSAVNDNEALFEEVSQHVTFFQEKSKSFQGMKETLQIQKAYVRSRCKSVLVIHGQPGCGKSAVLAKAARETHRWLKGNDVCVVARSIGATNQSTNIRSLLYDICRQLCVIYNNDIADVPTDYTGLVNDFNQRMAQATEDKTLVIYIDALDRLDDSNNGRNMTWLPKILHDNVHVIVSTLNNEKFECLPALKSLLGDDADMFLELPALQEADAMIILQHWINIHNHDVTPEQYDIIIETFKKCPSPLFLKLIFNEALKWASYTQVQQSKLPDTVKKMAAIKFGQMEVKVGECVTRRALGYLTAARNGLTDKEMLDLLSLDDAVISETYPQYRPVRRRCPPSLWLRLRHELSPYLTECNADNIKTVQWAHLHFYEAADERYLKQRDKAPSYHKVLAEYFLGKWVDKPKPYPGSDRGALRHVVAQPLYWEPKDSTDISKRVYNLRKINELPNSLLLSQQMALYKSETMCNFEWVLAKLCGTSLRSLVDEYHIGLEAEPSDADLKLLSGTLQLSANAMLRDPRQLAGQVVGRLQGIINRDIPSTPGDPPRYPYLHSFLAQAKLTSIPALIPSIGCLTEPGGILYDLLSGHSKPITAVTTTTDAQRALTASEDNTLKVWDLKSGKVTTTIDDFGNNVTKIRTALNNRFVISIQGSIIKVWCLSTLKCELVVDQYLDPPVITIANEGKLLVALFDGVNVLRTWDLEHEFKFVCEAKIEDKSVFSDNSVVLAPHSYGDYVLHAFRGNNAATIQHAKTGKVIHQLKCHDTSSSVVALAITRDYMIVACRQQYMKLHEIHQLEMFDAKKGKYLRSIRGCTQDVITELHINLVGSHAIAVCSSETSNSSNIMLWNLETEDHKHLAKHSGVSTVSACADFRYCLLAQKGDNTLKIWNISKNINQPMPKLKKSLGVAEIHPMIDNPRYAIARQVNHGPISIWNVAKAKCLASAVRIERGLSESSDIVLIRNTKVVILTEKGLKDSKPVFRTVLIYDLRQKRYVKKLTGCFIVPSPAHEYVLLDDETLLGPSETRNYFIIWSLENGKEMFSIRPSVDVVGRKGKIVEADLEHSLQMRASTAKLTPWDRRTETNSAKQRRRKQDRNEEKQRLEEIESEKSNAIEQYIISGDLNVIVASYFAHHLSVFSVGKKLHTQTLENNNSMLFLHVAALNFDGSCLVHANYDEASKISYVTLWDTETGHVKKRLKNETDVLAVAITDDASRVVFGKANKELRIWNPNISGPKSMKKIKGYDSLEFGVDSKIFMVNNGKRAVVFAGDISLWDLERATLLAAFTPDTRIECLNVVMNGQLITLGVHEYPELVVLKMSGKDVKQVEDNAHEDLFGETTGDTSDEDEDDDDDL